MFVRSRMTEDIVTVKPDSSLYDALVLFENHHYEGLPVVEGTKLVGVITEKIIMREFVAFCAKQNIAAGTDVELPIPFSESKLDLDVNKRRIAQFLHYRKVSELMATQMVTVDKEDPIELAADLMLQRDVNVLPVVNEFGDLKGIIGRTDILKVFDEVFGIKEEGERITIAIDDAVGKLAQITTVLRNVKVNIISIVTTQPRYRDVCLVILRVDQGEKAREALRKAGFKILFH